MDTCGVDERRVRNARIALQRAKATGRDDAGLVRAVLLADDAWCRDAGSVVAADELPRSLVRLLTALRFVYGDDGALEMLDSIVEAAVGSAQSAAVGSTDHRPVPAAVTATV